MKLAGLLKIPGTLCFVEDYHVLDRRSGIVKSVIAEVVNILMNALTLSPTFPFAPCPLELPPRNLVSCESLSEHRNQGAVAGQEDGVCRFSRRGAALRYLALRESSLRLELQ
jgi:hypothetical protein